MRESEILKILEEKIKKKSIKKSEEFESSLNFFLRLDKKLKAKLKKNSVVFELYERINDALEELHYIIVRDYFVSGFKNGFYQVSKARWNNTAERSMAVHYRFDL